MPDLATHLSVAYFVKKLCPKIEEFGIVFYLGTLLPDVLTRPFYTLSGKVYWFVTPLHTPLVLCLVCLLISYFFEEKIRKYIFISLVLGVFLHLLLDALQKRVGDVYALLFPLSWRDVYIGLFWPEKSLYFLPFLIFGILIYEIVLFLIDEM